MFSRGIQRTVKKLDNGAKTDDVYTVQGVIELALQRLRPVNDINSIISSRYFDKFCNSLNKFHIFSFCRTDAGVHALRSTLHVDLERPDKKAYNPNYITSYLNTAFFKYQIPVRINSTWLIPPDLPDFHCRYNAVGRTYLYRLAIPKSEKQLEHSESEEKSFNRFVPVEETDRCYFLQ